MNSIPVAEWRRRSRSAGRPRDWLLLQDAPGATHSTPTGMPWGRTERIWTATTKQVIAARSPRQSEEKGVRFGRSSPTATIILTYQLSFFLETVP